ncbi:hypothetical protein E2C01_005032 [Portunus trituberculatus]|uniref:Uncharacterized protein n=1 Tax=Portunus trituberculatus TaxID=210409 RepID=A0A5B7CSX4_PORTR|nr:hypothetical protein [Portunus trituberculatus]
MLPTSYLQVPAAVTHWLCVSLLFVFNALVSSWGTNGVSVACCSSQTLVIYSSLSGLRPSRVLLVASWAARRSASPCASGRAGGFKPRIVRSFRHMAPRLECESRERHQSIHFSSLTSAFTLFACRITDLRRVLFASVGRFLNSFLVVLRRAFISAIRLSRNQ